MSSIPNIPNIPSPTSILPDAAALNPLEAAGNWNEPKTAYGKIKGKKIKPKKGKKSTLYPFNKVYESELVEVEEFDNQHGQRTTNGFGSTGV